MLKQILSVLSLLMLVGANLPALGQKENTNWYFGANAAVNFPATGAPVAVRGSAMNTYEACASVSDAAGRLLFYTNSETLWNSNHQVMVNGTNLGGHNSCSQGTLIVQSQANAQQYYVFSLDAAENLLAGGLKYSLVDMTRQGGLGEAIQSRVQVSSVRLTEKLTTVPHANGHDTWVLVHGWQTNTFYAYLLTAAGLQPTPVATSIGAVHNGGGGATYNANAVGYMRVSPDNRKLALGIRDQNFELFDFDNATGQLSNYVPLLSVYRSYGVQFSPDNHLLYGTNLDGLGVFQYDLQAGSAAAIASSGVRIATTANNAGAIQTGPDGKLYVSVFNSPYLAVIDNPNVRGPSCGFRANGVNLNGAACQIGLPNYQSIRAIPVTYVASFTSNASCVGSAVAFTGTVQPAVSSAVATWNFGDPASGSANSGSGFTPSHIYTSPGTYQVTLSVSIAGLTAPVTSTQAVTVAPLPAVRLGRDTTLCGTQLQLSVGAQLAGSTYRWQDGSTSATYLARASGRYRVAVTSAAGCTSADSIRVILNALLTPRLPADTAVCAASVLLRPGTQLAGSTYRWQDGSTSATYLAQASGIYTVRVTTPQGCTATASSRVQLGQPPVVSLGADTLVCPNAVWILRTTPQPAGTLYSWQDGSTAPTYLAHGPGQYSVQVRATATSCPTSATRVATAASCPIIIPNIITPNGDAQNEFFTLKGLTPSDWHLSVFDRWGRQVYDQARYDNGWNATGQAGGMYYYLLSNEATGERYRGWVEVQRGS
ncbi:gliding motility-associated C-terminal domain-containing protein [Hymenobacter sp. BRD128]|uniref:T9SS type B sorting domain-containing protein n=1 Tax=Hymenobacter sp. BRD128 TaxID=2675878 RepID=UPI001563F79B|nr:gliding motility-associated C-terminal domain-containing protein [Hymenobacter sp. BRD128]QKG56756.1 gliding motility-associated C-terminal domain-containing protein [Hymenobacter sp. BRD128]